MGLEPVLNGFDLLICNSYNILLPRVICVRSQVAFRTHCQSLLRRHDCTGCNDPGCRNVLQLAVQATNDALSTMACLTSRSGLELHVITDSLFEVVHPGVF